MREIRCTALIIESGWTTEGQPTFYFTLLHPSAGEIRPYSALRLWVSAERDLFFVPDPHSDGSACFSMGGRGVRSAAAPWAHEADYAFGLKQADALLLAP